MRQTLLIIMILAACNLFAQTDTIDNMIKVEVGYEKAGTKYYYTVKTIYVDSSESIQKLPFPDKKSLVEFMKKQEEQVSIITANITDEIGKKQKYLKELNDKVKEYAETVNKEISKVNAEIKSLRTQRKLVNDSKEQLKDIR
jgi:hypothetical protein